MAEAMIALTDKLPSTSPLYAKNHLALDIIVVCPDGWPWTPTELTNPDWRLIKIPGVDPAVISQFCDPRLDVQGNVIRMRDWCFDVTQIPAAVMTFIQNNQVITLTTQQARKVATWMRKHSIDLAVS